MTQREVRKFFKNISYPDITFTPKFLKGGILKVIGQRELVDSDNGEEMILWDTQEFFYKKTNEFNMLSAIRDWIHKAECHEADEYFKYKGKRVFHPHKTKIHIY